MLNKFLCIGRLGRDPEVRYLNDGTPVCNFSIAMTEKFKSKGEDREITLWLDVSVWSKMGEACGQYLAKGSLVFIEGKIRENKWEDKQGQKRSKLYLHADSVKFLDKKKEVVQESVEDDSNVPF